MSYHQVDPSTISVPVVSFEGKEILERFSSNNSNSENEEQQEEEKEKEEFYVIAATPQEEYKLLRVLETQREIQCIDLLERNKLAEARAVERRLDLTRARMKDVEVLCRYTQSVYSSILAAQQPGFHPQHSYSAPHFDKFQQERSERQEQHKADIAARKEERRMNNNNEKQQPSFSSSTSATNVFVVGGEEGEEEMRKQEKVLQEEQQQEGITDMKNQPAPTGPITTIATPPVPFLLDNQDFKSSSGYCLVFSCNRAHKHLDELRRKRTKKFLLQRGGDRMVTSSDLLDSMSMAEFLTAEMQEIAKEVEEERRKAQQDFLQYKQKSTRTTAASFLADLERRHKEKGERSKNAAHGKERVSFVGLGEEEEEEEKEYQEQKREEKKEENSYLDNMMMSEQEPNQEKEKQQQHQLSFSCDGRLDELHFTEEAQRLSKKLRSSIDLSMEKLPLADWGNTNRVQGTEAALLASLDSLFGIIVARDKQSAEDFFQRLRKSETIGNEQEEEWEMELEYEDLINDAKSMEYGVPSAPPSSFRVPKHPTKFTHQNKKRKNPVGCFSKVLARVIPAGGSRACSDILKSITAVSGSSSSSTNAVNSSFTTPSKTTTTSSSSSTTPSSSYSSAGSAMSVAKLRKKQKELEAQEQEQQQQQQEEEEEEEENQEQQQRSQINEKQKDDDDFTATAPTAWWMKSVSVPSVELCGLTDALQRVITDCSPFVPQFPKNMILRGGTVSGALFSPDDRRAAGLCLVLDGDAGFEYTTQDAVFASKMFARVVEAHFGEVVQTFGDYATAVFWAIPQGFVLDEYERDDDVTTILERGVPLNRLAPATRAVVAAMELQKQVKRACCGVSVSAQFSEKERQEKEEEIRKEDERNQEAGLTESQRRRRRNWEVGSMRKIIYGPDADENTVERREIESNKLEYNARSHSTHFVTVSGAALDEAVRLALMSEKLLRRHVVVSSHAARECDYAMVRLIAFSHDLVEYFQPTALESIRLEEPPAEKWVGKYVVDEKESEAEAKKYQQQHQQQGKSLYSLGGEDDDDDDIIDLSGAINRDNNSTASGFGGVKKKKRKFNFHSIHSESTLRRLFVNLEPYRGCGYILRSQLKEVLYPLCFVDPLRVQAGASLESELASLARKHYEEKEAEKYQEAQSNAEVAAASASSLGSSATELSPMEAMRLMLLTARKEQRKKDRAASAASGSAKKGEAEEEGEEDDDERSKSLKEKLRDQKNLQEKVKNQKKRPGGVKSTLFELEESIQKKKKKKWEIQSDVHPDIIAMFHDIFRDDMIGVTHDVLDAMLIPLRENLASDHVTFPEFCLWAARLQSD